MAHSPTWRSWKSMKTRCLNPNETGFERYGGRNIRVCQRWLDSFENFLADMGERPSLFHSLDRIDNDGHYEPGNVRWATRTEQNRNKKTNVLLEIEGVTRTLSEWAEISGTHYETIRSRLTRGWGAKEAIFGRG